ncbi:hypothetical protein LINPERHAP1_LOCUS12851, partial [Linum perenne]
PIHHIDKHTTITNIHNYTTINHITKSPFTLFQFMQILSSSRLKLKLLTPTILPIVR